MAIDYVPVSTRLQKGIAAAPTAEWFFSDHMHPGRELALLEATLLYRELFGTLPHLSGLVVTAPMFGLHATFSANAPISPFASSPDGDTTSGYTYSTAQTATVRALAAGSDR